MEWIDLLPPGTALGVLILAAWVQSLRNELNRVNSRMDGLVDRIIEKTSLTRTDLRDLD